MPDPTANICRGCNGPKRRTHYLCRPCWGQLTPAAQAALNKRTGAAFRRLSDLHEQLRAGVPLHEIEIADA